MATTKRRRDPEPFEPTLPRFLRGKCDTASFISRNSDSSTWTEQWYERRAFATTEEASEAEVREYISARNSKINFTEGVL